MLHVGVDLHKRKAQIAVVNGEGKVLRNRAVACDREGMRGFFAKLPRPVEAVVEATSNWPWFCDLLEELEIPVTLSHPLKTKAIASARIKTDKIDAATLAQLLRADLLPEAHLASPQARLDRELLRHRAALVRLRTGVKNRIHALLTKENLLYDDGGLFTEKGKQWLANLPLHPVKRGVLERMLQLVEMLSLLIEEAGKEIGARAKDTEVARLLCTIPGVAHYSALLIVAEIDGIGRFPDAKHLCSYAGLNPSVHASADRYRFGHITKQGSPWLRWILVEICQTARSRHDFLGAYYRRLERRKGSGAAKVATARKLLKAIYFMLKEKQSFEQISDWMSPVGASS
jgi:transposase